MLEVPGRHALHAPEQLRGLVLGAGDVAVVVEAERLGQRVERQAADVLHEVGHGLRLRRGKILHTRNRHLRNHRGLSVACSNGCSVAFSNRLSLFSGIFQRIDTSPVDVTGDVNGFSVTCSNGFSLV